MRLQPPPGQVGHPLCSLAGFVCGLATTADPMAMLKSGPGGQLPLSPSKHMSVPTFPSHADRQLHALPSRLTEGGRAPLPCTSTPLGPHCTQGRIARQLYLLVRGRARPCQHQLSLSRVALTAAAAVQLPPATASCGTCHSGRCPPAWACLCLPMCLCSTPDSSSLASKASSQCPVRYGGDQKYSSTPQYCSVHSEVTLELPVALGPVQPCVHLRLHDVLAKAHLRPGLWALSS